MTPGQVLVVTSVMFTFISYWRTAAIVLCDLASTAYYIGGIVESQIGKAAPWFILAVMIFSYFVRMVYIESCSMFVRGGVYRVVKEAMGGGLAKLSVSALMFDYILTGPISGVSAGQYIIGLLGELFGVTVSHDADGAGLGGDRDRDHAVLLAGEHPGHPRVERQGAEDHGGDDGHGGRHDRLVRGHAGRAPREGQPADDAPRPLAGRPAGFAEARRRGQADPRRDGRARSTRSASSAGPALGDALRPGHIHWLSLIGVLGIFVAFGHSILAMSGEETLAQVYREVESPKLKNFKKAAFVVFVYSLLLTSLISFFAVMIIPDDVRLAKYSGNLIGGLAMNVVGPHWARLALNALVVGVGFLILSGAVNTAIVGSNGVLEPGVPRTA